MDSIEPIASTSSFDMNEPPESSDSQASSNSNESKIIKLDYCITSGERKNSSLIWTPADKQLYRKNTKSKIGVAYICYEKNCNVRVYIKDDECFKYGNSENHLHGSNEDLYIRFVALNEIKKQAILQKDKSLRDLYTSVKTK